MKFLKNKYFLLVVALMIIFMVYLFFFHAKKGLYKPSVIDKPVEKGMEIKPVEKGVEVPEVLSSSPHKESQKTTKRFILKLDDLDAIKNVEQEAKKKESPGISQDTMQENEVESSLSKKEEGKTLYKKGRISIKGKAGFSELPEKDDSLNDLIDKSEVKGDIGVEF